jgi:hypothetical protein
VLIVRTRPTPERAIGAGGREIIDSTLGIGVPAATEGQVKERFPAIDVSVELAHDSTLKRIGPESPDGPIRLDEDGGPHEARIKDVSDRGRTIATVDSFSGKPHRAVDEQLPDNQQDSHPEEPVQVERREEPPGAVSGNPPFDRDNDDRRSDEKNDDSPWE